MRILAIFIGIGILFFAINPALSLAKPCPTREEVESLVNSNNEFAFSMYDELSSENPNDNVFFSPFSISLALSMAYLGARGETASQMRDVLRFSLPDNKVYEAFSDLISTVGTRGKGYVLEVANALWGDRDYEFLKEFLEKVEKYYNGGFYRLSFKTDPEGSRKKINKWVEEKTHEKIKDLLPPNSITPLTKLVITNAIYFKGKWTYPFEKENTEVMPFYPAPDKKVDVPMMYNEEKFRYGEREGEYQVLELPYGDKTLSMVIVLPYEKDGLPQVEKNLSWDKFYEDLVIMKKQKVKVYIPKFKMERTYDLVAPLVDMGMKDAFNSTTADFSGMEPKRELYITDVVHKAYVDVNEEGTEAAAATGVVVALRAMIPQEPIVFKADHPFLYFIIHNPTHEILFMGKIENPLK